MYREKTVMYVTAEEKMITPSYKVDGDDEFEDQPKEEKNRLGKVGFLLREHIKNEKPEMYFELVQKGILEHTLYEIQGSIKQQMDLIENQI